LRAKEVISLISQLIEFVVDLGQTLIKISLFSSQKTKNTSVRLDNYFLDLLN